MDDGLRRYVGIKTNELLFGNSYYYYHSFYADDNDLSTSVMQQRSVEQVAARRRTQAHDAGRSTARPSKPCAPQALRKISQLTSYSCGLRQFELVGPSTSRITTTSALKPITTTA